MDKTFETHHSFNRISRSLLDSVCTLSNACWDNYLKRDIDRKHFQMLCLVGGPSLLLAAKARQASFNFYFSFLNSDNISSQVRKQHKRPPPCFNS